MFQPTPPSEKSGDRILRGATLLNRVSTHAALREERRPGFVSVMPAPAMFQPTPPSEKSGDSRRGCHPGQLQCFNPRRPPRRAATRSSSRRQTPSMSFNPRRPPRRAATHVRDDNDIENLFQPTPPSEKSGDPMPLPWADRALGFNPRRPPRRAATSGHLPDCGLRMVSTHAALREERRPFSTALGHVVVGFRPTPPSEKSGDTLRKVMP